MASHTHKEQHALSADEVQQARQDVTSLRGSLASSRSDLVTSRVGAVLDSLEGELAAAERALRTEHGKDTATLWFKVNSGTPQKLVEVPAAATLAALKQALSEQLGVPPSHQHLSSVGVDFSAPEATPLASLGLADKSVINVTSRQPALPGGEAGAALRRIRRSGAQARTPFQSLCLALHAFMVEGGFVCTGLHEEEGGGSSVRGFAPPVRDVPEDKLVPEGWNAEGTIVSFRYRHPQRSGSVYLLKLLEVNGTCVANLGEKGGAIETAEFSVAEHEAATLCGSDSAAYYTRLHERFQAMLVNKVLPAAARQQPAQRDTPQPQQPQPRGEDKDPLRIGAPRLPGPMPMPGMGPGPGGLGAPGYGGDFSGDLVPGGGPGFPGGGGLMGPGHPMFGGPRGMHLPQPRFDPYGPPMPGFPGGPGRGFGGGRGDGNGGRGRQPQFGEPNPDHLRPPGDLGPPDNMFF